MHMVMKLLSNPMKLFLLSSYNYTVVSVNVCIIFFIKPLLS